MLIWSSAPRACGQCLTRPFSRLYGPLGFVNGCPRARDRSPTGHQRYSSTRFIDGNPDAGTQYLLFLRSDPWRSPGSASVIQRTITPAMGADHIIEACSVWPDLGVEVSQYSTSAAVYLSLGIPIVYSNWHYKVFLCCAFELDIFCSSRVDWLGHKLRPRSGHPMSTLIVGSSTSHWHSACRLLSGGVDLRL